MKDDILESVEAEPRDGKSNGGRFEIEQRAAEQYAKSAGIWIPMDDIFVKMVICMSSMRRLL